MRSVQFDTAQFQFSHGKAPRGVGSWAFEVKGETFWAPGQMSFSDAKRAAAAKAREAGVSRVKVMP